MTTTDSLRILTPTQLSALLILMAEAREVTNDEFEQMARFRLDGDDRRGLVEQGLVENRKVGRAFAFQLSEKGWRFCKQLHDAKVNVGSSIAARSIFVLLNGLHRSLDRLRVSHAEFFKQSAEAPSTDDVVEVAGGDDLEASIRRAYRDLVRKSGQWIGIADLRESLPDVDRSVMDETLRAMAQMKGVRIIPVANSKALDDRDRAAALRMGGEDHHALSIGQA